jgi:hypothetical protein
MASCKAKENAWKTSIEAEIKAMKHQIETLAPSNNNITINIQNNTVNIREFGNEDISYLPKEFVSWCFANKDIVRLLENIHCDKEHPENHNIRIRSQKRNQIETRQNNHWRVMDKDKALAECVKNGYRVLVKHGRRHREQIIEEELDDDEREYESITDWLEDVYENEKSRKPLENDLYMVLLTHRN